MLLNYLFQCILPCIVHLLSTDDPLVHWIRAYQRYRIMIDMHCMTDDRIATLKQYILDYRALDDRRFLPPLYFDFDVTRADVQLGHLC